MEFDTLARPYSKAAFQYAKKNDVIEDWLNLLQIISIINTNGIVASTFKNTSLPYREKVGMIINLIDIDVTEEFKRYLLVIAENNKLFLLTKIYLQFVEMKYKESECQKVNVYYVFPLSNEQKKTIVQKFSTEMRKKIELNLREDKSLIGGIIIELGDQVFDGSIKTRLSKLSESIS